jgi:hypothetical protein
MLLWIMMQGGKLCWCRYLRGDIAIRSQDDGNKRQKTAAIMISHAVTSGNIAIYPDSLSIDIRLEINGHPKILRRAET